METKLITRNPLPPAQLPLPRGLEPLVASVVPWQPLAQGIGPFAAEVPPVVLLGQDYSIISHKRRDP